MSWKRFIRRRDALSLPTTTPVFTRLPRARCRTCPLFEALNRVADGMRLRWNKDGEWLQFRSTSYFHDRLKEVPNRLLTRWAESPRRARCRGYATGPRRSRAPATSRCARAPPAPCRAPPPARRSLAERPRRRTPRRSRSQALLAAATSATLSERPVSMAISASDSRRASRPNRCGSG